jgi:energy-coupling factor transporter ATP-binding protein EcfA2
VSTIKIAQIKGSNGSGKTTIVQQLMGLSHEISQLQTENGIVLATCFDTIKWAAIGPYDLSKKMGGCDCLNNIDLIKQAILTVRQECSDYWIVFEGMMISTIKTTFYNFLAELSFNDSIEPVMVILRTDVDGCLRRIAGRGTMKPDLNIGNIRTKCELVLRHAQEYDPRVVRYIDVDAVACSGMLTKFLDAVGDTKLLDWMFNYRDVEESEFIKSLNREYMGPEWLEEYSRGE